MEVFDPALIEQFLGYLTPNNVLLEITAPDALTKQMEPWFQVPYSLVKGPLPRKTVSDAPLRLPTANPYLPEKLDLVAADTQTMQRVIDKPELTWLDTTWTLVRPGQI